MNKSVARIKSKNITRSRKSIINNAYEILQEWNEDMSELSDRDKHIIDAFTLSMKNNKTNIKLNSIGPKKRDDDSYYSKYKREKVERKRLQRIVGLIDERIEKVNKENEEIYEQLKIEADYWRFSFMLSENHGVDFLNYEIGLIEKGLIKKEEVKIKDE